MAEEVKMGPSNFRSRIGTYRSFVESQNGVVYSKIDDLKKQRSKLIGETIDKFKIEIENLKKRYEVEQAESQKLTDDEKQRRIGVQKNFESAQQEYDQAKKAYDENQGSKLAFIKGKKLEKEMRQKEEALKMAEAAFKSLGSSDFAVATTGLIELEPLFREGILEDTLKDLKKYAEGSGPSKAIEERFPFLVREVKKIDEAIKEEHKKVNGFEIIRINEFEENSSFLPEEHPREKMVENDLAYLEVTIPYVSVSGKKAGEQVHVTEGAYIDWSIKENKQAATNPAFVSTALLICPESIETLPVEIANYVFKEDKFKDKYLSVLTEENYNNTVGRICKGRYPTFKQWRSECVVALEEKMKEIKAYRQAKMDCLRDLVHQNGKTISEKSLADWCFSIPNAYLLEGPEFEGRKKTAQERRSSDLEALESKNLPAGEYLEERRKIERRDCGNEAIAETYRAWSSTIRKRMTAILESQKGNGVSQIETGETQPGEQ